MSSHGGSCTSNDDCESDKTCLSEDCVNPCALVYCNHGCTVQNHGAFCVGNDDLEIVIICYQLYCC